MSVLLPKEHIKKVDFETINFNIDSNLKLMSTYPKETFLQSFFIISNEDKLPSKPKLAIMQFMILEKLIETENEHTYSLTKLGYEIYRKGGWIKYLEREKIKLKREETKNIFDFKISKFKYYTFWFFFAFGFIGFILSVFNFGKNLLPSENEELQEQQLEKMEREVEKLQIYILSQKNLDSLSNSNYLTKSLKK